MSAVCQSCGSVVGWGQAVVATPTEVEALRADAAEWQRLCFIAEPEMAAMRTELMRAGAECADAMTQVVTLRARVAELEGALLKISIGTWNDPNTIQRQARAALSPIPTGATP